MTKPCKVKVRELTSYSLEVISRALRAYDGNGSADLRFIAHNLAVDFDQADAGKLTRRIATEEH